ncbi:MAG: hypothetical protein KJ950_16540 [Proteobacteria bacterium]|nr:hypothetical protein [Pseudomonadota bacterium]MBU1686193.1 hypothetical protein [Pseudomonadota bacterium]
MTQQSKVDKICNNVQQAFNPPRIRFMKIVGYPANTGMRISFDYRDNTKTITFSEGFISKHSESDLANFLNHDVLSRLKEKGDQHLQLE